LRSFEGLPQFLKFTGREWGVERNRWIFIVLGRCEGIVLSLRREAKARLIAGQYFFDPSFLKGCAQITPERQRVLVKVSPSYDYIFQASEEKAQLFSRSQVKRFQNHSSLKNRPANFFQVDNLTGKDERCSNYNFLYACCSV